MTRKELAKKWVIQSGISDASRVAADKAKKEKEELQLQLVGSCDCCKKEKDGDNPKCGYHTLHVCKKCFNVCCNSCVGIIAKKVILCIDCQKIAIDCLFGESHD